MQLINCRGITLYVQGLLPLSTSVHNDADNANDYSRVIGIALLKAFSCAKNWIHTFGAHVNVMT